MATQTSLIAQRTRILRWVEQMHYLSILCLTLQLNCYLQKKNQSYIQTEVYTTVGQDGEKWFHTLNVKEMLFT